MKYINKLIRNKIALETLHSVVSNINFDYCIIKGMALSKILYQNESTRYGSDIDILIDKSNIEMVEKTLVNNGFSKMSNKRINDLYLYTCSHQIVPYVKKINNILICIDINFDILWGEDATNLFIDEFINDSIDITLMGYSFKTLTLLKSFLQLSLHHYKDFNSLYILSRKNSITLEKFNELYKLFLLVQDKHTPQELYDICKKYKINQYIYYIIHYIYILFNDNKLIDYINILKTPKGEKLIDCYGLNDKERKIWSVDFLTRLNDDFPFKYIEPFLSENDIKKIKINKKVFG